MMDREELEELYSHWWIDALELINKRNSFFSVTILGVGGESYYKNVKLNWLDMFSGIDITMKTNYELQMLSQKIEKHRNAYLKKTNITFKTKNQCKLVFLFVIFF